MTTSGYIFVQDLVDEGADVVLDRLARAGLDGVTMAATYHHARDVCPHNPRHRVVYHEGGVAYFQPQLERYGRLRPRTAALARDGDPLTALREATDRHGMHPSAWVVVLHNSRLAFEHPDCAPMTAFGDRLLNWLCPAHPDVRAYATALVSNIARFAYRRIDIEAVAYPTFDHGYHHERSFVRLSPNVRFLLGLCCCPYCLAAAEAAGVDAQRVQATIREHVQAVFDSSSAETHESEVTLDELASLAGGELGHFLDARRAVVASLVHDITAAVKSESPETRVVYLDPSGATLGYTTGRPTTERTAVEIAWQDGIDLRSIGQTVDGMGVLAYFADPGRWLRELEAYSTLLNSADLEVVLRPMPPDTSSPEELREKLVNLRRLRRCDASFYHYGLMRLENLDWVHQALIAA